MEKSLNIDSSRYLYYTCPSKMLLLRSWNRLLALPLLSGALFCILVPGCDGVDVVLASQQSRDISSVQPTDLPGTPAGDECGCWCRSEERRVGKEGRSR